MEWIKLSKYPQFSITECGQVRNDLTGVILKHNKDKKVKLSFNGKSFKINVKNLLATTFLPNPDNKKRVLNKDGNPLNIALDNLEWSNWSGGGIIVEKLKQGTILNNFTVIEDLYEPNVPRRLVVKCNKCEKTVSRSFTKINRKECACDKQRTKSKQERNKEYLRKNKKRLIHTIGGEESIMLCRKCRKLETVKNSNISDKINKYCCEEKKTEKTYLEKVELKLKEVFSNMKVRCYKDYCKDYKNYGARGIKICDEWLNNINSFIEWSLDNGFILDKRLSIDRIDNDGDYCPNNCQWIPLKLNVRKNRHTKLTYENVLFIKENMEKGTMTNKELTKMFKLNRHHINLIMRGGAWNIDDDMHLEALKVLS